jgi:hypothetical protein
MLKGRKKPTKRVTTLVNIIVILLKIFENQFSIIYLDNALIQKAYNEFSGWSVQHISDKAYRASAIIPLRLMSYAKRESLQFTGFPKSCKT